MRRMLSSLALAAVVAASFAQTNSGQSTTTGAQNGTTSITTPVQQTTTISSFATANNMTWEDAAAALALARAYNMQPNMIITQRGTVTSPYFDIAPAYMIANQSGKPFNEIWQMYNSGTSWMDIAHQLNVSPTYYNPSNSDVATWTNTDFQNGVWTYILQNSYKMTPEDFTYFSDQHVPMNQVVVADVYGMEANRPVRDIYTDYTKYNDWPKMYQTYSSTTSTTMPANNGNTGNGGNGNQGANGDMSNNNRTAGMVAPDPIKEWQVIDMDPASEMSAHSSSTYGMSKGQGSSSHKKSKKHKSTRRHRG